MSLRVFILAAFSLFSTAHCLDVVINEFSASNQTGLSDEDGAHPDWIELLNLTGQPVPLAGWHLTDESQLPSKWTFPAINLPAGGYLVIFASGKNRTPTNGNLHTNFKLNADGEYLGLVRPDLHVEHEWSPKYPDQLVDVSYGLEPGFVDLAQARYFQPSSPGTSNQMANVVWNGQIPPVLFSQTRGFFTNTVNVALSCADPLAEIRYTLDGSPPAATNGVVYAGTVALSASDVMRASAFRAGYLPAAIKTHSYIFSAEAGFQTFQHSLDAGFPPTWRGFPADYGMDPDVVGPGDLFGGRYAATIADDLLAIPTVCLSMPVADFFGTQGIYSNPTQSGTNWERACSFEFMDPSVSGLVFQVNAGVQLIGGAFRSFGVARKKSFRVVFKEKYGGKKLFVPLFGPDAANSFDTLVLRMESNDGYSFRDVPSVQYTRDTYSRELQRRMGHSSGHSRPVHLYLNGIYWGLYNLGERPDDEFASDYLGGSAADYDVLTSGNPPNATNVVNGDGDPVRVARTLGSWSNLVASSTAVLNASNEVSRTTAYFAMMGRNPDGTANPNLPVHLNLASYVDYLILNHWLGNRDWPWQNYYAARLNGPASAGWTFFSWDAEWTLGSATPTNENRIADARGCALPFQNLRASAEFRQYFADRIHHHFRPGGVFYVDPVNPGYDPLHPEHNLPAALYAEISDPFVRPVVAESARWGDQWSAVPYTVDLEWKNEQRRLTNGYFRVRSALVLDQYRAAGLLPLVVPPVAQPAGSEYDTGTMVTLSAPGGTIYYTLDGSDPRAIGGGISTNAIGGIGPISLAGLVHLRARALNADEWSPITEETYIPRLRLLMNREPSFFRFSWNPIQDVPHTLESSPSLSPPVWTSIGTVSTNGPGRLDYPFPPGIPLLHFRVIR